MSDRSRLVRRTLLAAGLLLVLALPFYLDGFWLLLGVLIMAAAIGAIGLNLLVGTAGQLSLAHAFFLAVGAYSYCWFAGDSGPAGGGITLTGLHLPSLLAAVLAVATAGFAGLLFSPIAGRVRGLYLGLASLALVFVGQHLLFNLSSVTGGYNGRRVPALAVAGFELTGNDPQLTVLGVPFGDRERQWYVALVCVVVAYLFARNVLTGRPGRALALMRDNETAAAVVGVPVHRYKAAAFVLSSMYAGAAGVLLAQALQRVVPDYFGLALSVDYLAMVVIGGLGSVAGSVLGAAFVTGLPTLLTHYSDHLSFLAEPGSSGVDPAVAARLVFGAAMAVVILMEPGGLVTLSRRLRFPLRKAGGAAPAQPPQTAARASAPAPHDIASP
ncbi:branched-chain amino acid ABC transporter permease [Streptomyces sp. NPDC047081]|uniref:branched-chain amino acid ABC transporter permease n=1 Tax=Streptomyces sp. NPDC047081 TaxID=3154706 RepID=UPI0033F162D7